MKDLRAEIAAHLRREQSSRQKRSRMCGSFDLLAALVPAGPPGGIPADSGGCAAVS